jgi:hypothetical protein
VLLLMVQKALLYFLGLLAALVIKGLGLKN